MRRAISASLLALAPATGTRAATVIYDWSATWVWGDPDGFGRPLIGINHAWPCPMIEASVGDTVVINLENRLGNETTGLHFHGIDQIDSNFMDGAVGTSQCPLLPGLSMTYSFRADSAGTYWYHSHSMGQYPDGLRGPLIIHNPEDPYQGEYDQDIILTISDWYHSQTPKLISDMIQPRNQYYVPPLPNGILLNEGGDGRIPVQPGRTYRFRIINLSAMTGSFVEFSSSSMSVIMMDGSYTRKQIAQQLLVAASQRYDVLVRVPEEVNKNHPFLFSLDTNPDWTDPWPMTPIGHHFNFTGQLVTDPNGDMGQQLEVQTFQPSDDATHFLPHDGQPTWGPVTKQWVLNFDYCPDVNGYPRACFNNMTYVRQLVPALYTATSLGVNNTEVAAYGQINAFTVAYGEVLEIVINNHDAAVHPFHLHGHQFQVIARPFSNAGDWVPGASSEPAEDTTPPRRDTISIYSKSHAVLRIVANNPGVFLLHCHVEWHVEMGLTATLIEAPERLIYYPIPPGMKALCAAQGIPTSGNAAGNPLWSDTTGFVTVPPQHYSG
ncbi:Cupredoxin [Xylariomycetidae sp. FL0641]|nr:Cupredoxin [Xylariomycetidae sp. FL0641]